jgi:hypothetical protein
MIFRPAKVAELWDSWLYRHEGTHWMFFLHKSDGSRWDGISLARSADGVHYEELGTVVEVSPDADSMGSGTVHRLPDGRFIMNLSETRKGVQSIFFLESRDLRTWRQFEDPGRLAPDPRLYDDGTSGRWDGIDVLPRPGGGYVGYLTARPWNGPDDPEYVSVGKLESGDGLHWRAVAPPRIAWGAMPESSVYEVGGVEMVGGAYRMMICQVASERRLGRRTAWSPGLGDAGMYGFRSASLDGPFEPDGTSYRLLTSPSWIPGGLPYSGMSHFTRFYRCDGDVLVNHHAIEFCGDGSSVWFAPLKRTRTGTGGELQLAWWEGNEALKGGPLALGFPGGEAILQAPGRAWAEAGGTITATASCAGGIYRMSGRFDPVEGVVLEIRATVRAAPRALGTVGIAIGHPVGGLIGYPPPVGLGTAFLLGTGGRTDIGFVDRSGTVHPQHVVGKGITDGVEARLRLVTRRGMCELYRDDELVQCWSLPAMPTGELYLVFEGGSAVFSGVRAWRMSP